MLINTTSTTDRLSLAAVITTDAFLQLNPAMRKFVVSYVEKGLEDGNYDAVAALHHAYGPSIKHAEIRAYQMLRKPAVRKVLDIHFKRSGLESILSDLKRAARKSVRLGLGLTPATEKALAAFEKYAAALEEIAAKENTIDVKAGK